MLVEYGCQRKTRGKAAIYRQNRKNQRTPIASPKPPGENRDRQRIPDAEGLGAPQGRIVAGKAAVERFPSAGGR
jgi:hypothetical protein